MDRIQSENPGEESQKEKTHSGFVAYDLNDGRRSIHLSSLEIRSESVTANRIFLQTGQQLLPSVSGEPDSPKGEGMESLLNAISHADQESLGRFLFLVANSRAAGLADVLSEVPEGLFEEIVLVDAGCPDAVLEQAARDGLTIINATDGEGPGHIRKLCFQMAQRNGAGMLVLFELQHTRDLSPLSSIVQLLEDETWDVILGNRFDDYVPMSRRRRAKNHVFGPERSKQLVADILYGQRLVDPDTDFIACRTHPLWVLPYRKNKDSQVFHWQFLAQTLGAGFRIGELPLRVTRSTQTELELPRIGLFDRLACARTVFISWLKRFRIWRKDTRAAVHPESSLPPADSQ